MNKPTQLTHAEHQASGKKFPVSIIADSVSSPLNIGSLFRLCDALGIEKLYLCGQTPAPPNSKINRTSRSTEKYVSYDYFSDAKTLVKDLKDNGAYIVSLEITSGSVSINSVEFKQAIKNRQQICLILGSEINGVSETLLSLSDITVFIPMYGNNSSMNVVSAASIACYELTSQLENGSVVERLRGRSQFITNGV